MRTVPRRTALGCAAEVLDKTGQLRRPHEINRQPIDQLAIAAGDGGERAPFVGGESRISEQLPAVKGNGDREGDRQGVRSAHRKELWAPRQRSDCGALAELMAAGVSDGLVSISAMVSPRSPMKWLERFRARSGSVFAPAIAFWT